MVIIQNDFLTVAINKKGAEIKSVKGKNGTEFMWCANPDIWGSSAPMLFPVCGAMKDEKYTLEGNTYFMPAKHGFAKRMEFDVKSLSETKVVFSLKENEETLKVYPFRFELEATYELNDNVLEITTCVKNNSETSLYYSIGCHEGYSCPEGIGEYVVEFPGSYKLVNHLTEGPLMSGESELYLENCKELSLSPDIFTVDSLIFKDSGIYSAALKHRNSSKKITVSFPGYDVLVIWQKPGAEFICIEPWKGLPDYVDTDGDLTKKVGIICVAPNESDKSVHTIKFEE